MSHAPGTWDVRTGSLSIYTNYGGSTYHKVADARQSLFTRECQEANVRLIAAAPDLLAALTDAYQYMVDYKTCQNQGLLDDMQAAIAKAKGA